MLLLLYVRSAFRKLMEPGETLHAFVFLHYSTASASLLYGTFYFFLIDNSLSMFPDVGCRSPGGNGLTVVHIFVRERTAPVETNPLEPSISQWFFTKLMSAAGVHVQIMCWKNVLMKHSALLHSCSSSVFCRLPPHHRDQQSEPFILQHRSQRVHKSLCVHHL